MDARDPFPDSQVFLVRIWTTSGPDGAPVWRGKVQPLCAGGMYCFDRWPDLIGWLHTATQSGETVVTLPAPAQSDAD